MKYFYFIYLFIGLWRATTSERLHEQIYSPIDGAAACFRRLNGTHQAGCATSIKGSVGVVQMINDVSDAHWIVVNGTAGPYIAIVSTKLFQDVIEIFMESPENVAGVLIHDNSTNRPSFFSEESRCPNEYSADVQSNCSSSRVGGTVWNEHGTGLIRRDIPFAIFYLPQSGENEVLKIKECYERFNLDKDNQNERPMCSVQMKSFMYAAVNSAVCKRRSASTLIMAAVKMCDSLGDLNVFYSLFPRVKNETKNESVIFVTSRIDSASLFDGISPGAASSVVGLVTLVTAASTLSKLIPQEDAHLYDKNVLFTLFNGEAFDYIGSQRVAFDMDAGRWPPAAPLRPDRVSLHVDVGQIGGSLTAKQPPQWYAYVPQQLPEITSFLDIMSQNIAKSNMNISTVVSNNLPPSSLHSFRRILKNVTDSGKLPEFVLVDFKDTFVNDFYQSALDTSENIGFVYRNITVDENGRFVSTAELIATGLMKETDPQVRIAQLSTSLVYSLYETVVGKKYTGDIETSAHLVDEMLYCLLQNQACRLLLAGEYANNNDEVPATSPPLYVGVAGYTNTPTVFAGHLLALLAGRHLPAPRDQCMTMDTPGCSYLYLKGWNNSGVCIETTMNYSAAVSPAFVIPDYDMSSHQYSTWTESVWLSMSVRVFVRASGAGARWAACGGAASTALALALTFWLKRHRAQLFSESPPAAVRDDAASGILRTVNC